MKIFVDTNVFLEYLEHRLQFENVKELFDAAEDGRFELCMSSGGFYTITYLITMGLKKKGIYKPEQTAVLTRALNAILCLANIIDVSHSYIEKAVNDENFIDKEDGFQYYCALENDCDIIVTINIKDYKTADGENIKVISPSEFSSTYL